MNNPPAFPRPMTAWSDREVSPAQEGMTLRDWFAGMALQGLIRGYENPIRLQDNLHALSTVSFAMAEAMLREREKYKP